MTLKTAKPNRCKFCKVRLPADMARHVLHPECIDPWVAIQREKQEKARVKAAKVRAAKDKRETRAKLIEKKGRGYWMAQAQKAFNEFVRLRDAYKGCVSCRAHLPAEAVGGGFDCGHYRSVGSAPHMRFVEDNAHGQCKKCNRYLSGNITDYRARLLHRIGVERLDALESDQESRKWSIDDLKQIKATYAAKVRALKARTE